MPSPITGSCLRRSREARPCRLPALPLGPCEVITGWSHDGRSLLLRNRCETAARVARVEVQTGERTPWVDLQLGDPTGIIRVSDPHYAGDDAAYAYAYFRTVSSDLYLVDGLK